MILIAIEILFLIIIIFWVYGFYIRNDFSVPTAYIKKFKNVLIIYPHADDELFTAGGFISALSKQKSSITLVILTMGERGNFDTHYDENLKITRTNEAKIVASILKVTKLIQEDFGDNDLKNKRDLLKEYISKLITNTNPDLILTYDKSGLYGHPDHIIVSEIVTDLAKSNGNVELWYATLPQRTLNMINLPEHMATDINFKTKRVLPTFKVSSLPYKMNKYKALMTYQSQLSSFKNHMPIKFIPLWFYDSMSFYEYFYKVNLD